MIFKILSSCFFLIYLIYLGGIVKYILVNLIIKKTEKKFFAFWIDYLLTIIVLFTFSICNILNNFFITTPNLNFIISLNFLRLVFSSNFILNIILLIQAIFKIKTFQKITSQKNVAQTSLITEMHKIKFDTFYRHLPHLLKIAVSYCINLIILVVIYICNKEKIINLFKAILFTNIYQLIIFLIQLILTIIVNIYHKNLLEIEYRYLNISVDKIINNYKSKVSYIVEHILYKTYFDYCLCLTSLLRIFLFNNKNIKLIDNSYENSDEKTTNIILENTFNEITMLGGIFYMYYMGGMILNLDMKRSRIIPILIKKLLGFSHFYFYFGNGKKEIKLYKDIKENENLNKYIRYLNLNRKKIENLNFMQTNNKLNRKLNEDLDVSLVSDTYKTDTSLTDISMDKASKNASTFIDEKFKEIEIKIMKREKVYNPFNFYVIYNLLYLYFLKNRRIYESMEKCYEDLGMFNTDESFNEHLKKNNIILNSGRASNINKGIRRKSINNMKERVSRLSRMSIKNSEKLQSTIKFNSSEIMQKLEDKDLLYFFKEYMSNDDDNKLDSNDLELHIESLMNETLFELYPYFQIYVKDLMISLDPAKNIKLLYYFFNKKQSDKSFNSYFSIDSFLTYEIYDSDFLTYDQIKLFISKYKTYLIDKISNFSYSFLPLIIGIFHIKYLEYDKIIILYRNQISFMTSIPYLFWMHFQIGENGDKTMSSKNEDTNNLLDPSEIEIKNNIQMEMDEYNETMQLLDADIEFLKSVNYQLDFKFNLFVLNDNNQIPINTSTIEIDNSKKESTENLNINEQEKENILNNKDMINLSEISDEDSDENNKKFNELDFNKLVRESNLNYEDINDGIDLINLKKKYFGSDVISPTEKLYLNDKINSKYIFKIYFSDIFKKKKILNDDNMTENLFDDSTILKSNSVLCKFLKKKLIKRITVNQEDFLDNLEE